MSAWKLTGTAAALWWIAAVLQFISKDFETATTLVFTAAGWTGWAYEERKNEH